MAAAKETAEEFQRVLSAIFDALNLSEAQREMVPQVVPRVLELLIAHCHPPAAWDQVEGFSAMSMGPPGRQ